MLITLEGIDGAGKTTVWEALHDSVDAEFTREPTQSWYGDCVRESVADADADPLAELFLYTADHAAHLADIVRPALEDDKVVISDRYADSRYAYQGAALEDEIRRPMEYIRGIHKPFTREPDATIYLEIPPEQGAQRAGATDKFESAEYLRAVQSNYEQLIEYDEERFVRVDATQPPEDVIEQTEWIVEQLVE